MPTTDRMLEVITVSYPQLLSDSAYKVLVRLLGASRKASNVVYPDLISLNKRLHLDSPYSESPWRELEDMGFIRIDREDGGLTIKLDARRINADCGGSDFGRLRIRVSSLGSGAPASSGPEDLTSRIQKVLGLQPGSQLIPVLLESISKLRAYCESNDRELSEADLRKMLSRLSLHDHHVIEEACRIYNEDESIHTTKGWGYLVRIAGNIAARPTGKKASKYRRAMVARFKERDNPVNDELERKFALKLALGDVDGSRVYKRLLEAQPLRLVELWRRGSQLLHERGEEHKLRSDYEWLKGALGG